MFWTAPETQLGDPIKIVSCNDVIFLVGSKGVQRIHGTAVSIQLSISLILFRWVYLKIIELMIICSLCKQSRQRQNWFEMLCSCHLSCKICYAMKSCYDNVSIKRDFGF